MTAASSIVPLLMSFTLQMIIIDEASQLTEHAAVAVIANSIPLSTKSSSLEMVFNAAASKRRMHVSLNIPLFLSLILCVFCVFYTSFVCFSLVSLVVYGLVLGAQILSYVHISILLCMKYMNSISDTYDLACCKDLLYFRSC